MKELPILFSGPMVRAIRDGRKTMTRRLVTPQPEPRGKIGTEPMWFWTCAGMRRGDPLHPGYVHTDESALRRLIAGCSRFQVGRRMWVRETCWIWGQWVRNGATATGRQKWRFRSSGQRVIYERPAETAKRGGDEGWGYRHARYMPRWASRITLVVTAHRVERLHEITAADVRAEGIQLPVCEEGAPLLQIPSVYEPAVGWRAPTVTVADYWIAAFAQLWEALNKRRAPWSSNPWIEVVSFERVTP